LAAAEEMDVQEAAATSQADRMSAECQSSAAVPTMSENRAPFSPVTDRD